ncbi:hypothetical protein AGLY_003768 [Aphis glycines]|uniref:Uncharacterized protein n=1 Tax=Aphis glycines TaxID=307491 RepID=A0A6G0U0I7_APHGL|nr:hypothetical protein AGLY_003768 [Aphis glycines]
MVSIKTDIERNIANKMVESRNYKIKLYEYKLSYSFFFIIYCVYCIVDSLNFKMNKKAVSIVFFSTSNTYIIFRYFVIVLFFSNLMKLVIKFFMKHTYLYLRYLYLYLTELTMFYSCSARERVDSAHPLASPYYQNWFPYGRVMLGDVQKNRFWLVCSTFSRWTDWIIFPPTPQKGSNTIKKLLKNVSCIVNYLSPIECRYQILEITYASLTMYL